MATTTPPITARPSARAELRRGALGVAPLLLGYAPFALVIGDAISKQSNPAAGWAGIWLILGGSAHLATLRALEAGSALAALATGILVNARLVLYSTSLRRHWSGHPRWFKIVAGLLLIDPTWAVAEQRATEPGSDADQRVHYLAAATTLAVGWGTMITTGMVVGSSVTVDLNIVVPLCLVVLVAPRLQARPGRSAAVAAGSVTLVTSSWPAGTGLLVAVVVGAGIAISMDARAEVTS